MTESTGSAMHLPLGSTLVVGDVQYLIDTEVPLERVVEYETLRTDHQQMKGDPAWVKAHGGHDHFWDGKTVANAHREYRHVDCDGSCGGVCEAQGYDAPAWICDVYASVVRPDYVPDYSPPPQYKVSDTVSLGLLCEDQPAAEIRGRAEVHYQDPASGRRYINVLTGADEHLRLFAGDTTFEHGSPLRVTYTGNLIPAA